MKIVKNIKYWFTPEGGDEYELILNKYYEKLKTKTTQVEVIHKSGFEIWKMKNYPDEGLYTFLTKGLSSYILGNLESGYIRREQAITVDSKYRDLKIDVILDFISQEQLENREPFETDEIISLKGNETITPIINETNLDFLFFAGAVWLDDEQQGFFGPINTNISEVLLITDTEREIINLSIDSFIAKTQEGIIDILDLERS
ncbi:MAG: hypothetical protein R3E90_14825 [Marinicella sp.]